jgi:hypothetical protein
VEAEGVKARRFSGLISKTACCEAGGLFVTVMRLAAEKGDATQVAWRREDHSISGNEEPL